MATVISFINEKGGIGKTSACFNIAWELSSIKKILMIDLDGQKANLSFFCGVKKSDDMKTMFDVLQMGLNIREAIRPVKNNLDIVPANVNVADLNSQAARITKLKEILKDIGSEYDYIFIDVNPTPNWNHALALSTSDYCIILMLPDIASLEANMGIIESIREMQGTSNPNLKVMGLLFNKSTNRTRLSQEVRERAERMAEQLETKVFDTKIRDLVRLSENVLAHVGVTEYAPKDRASDDIRSIVAEIDADYRNKEVR